jgi:carboxymethylenebutenolidase
MCDQDHFEEDLKKYSRREMGVLAAAGVGAAMMLPRAANAAEVTEGEVSIQTPDGECDAYFVSPQSGAHAAVLVWPDIFGLRPAFRQMGKRLAESGYSVLVINPFYRTKKAPTAENGASTPIADVIPLARTLNATTHTTDAKAFIAWLDSRPQVDKNKKMGTI